MSAAVVLLGCWTAGKSSLVRRLKEKNGETVSYIDSDEFVGDAFAGSLYNIYLAHAERSGINSAREYIDLRERLLLARLLSLPKPYVLAAGPLLATREPIWTLFLNYVRPICFHLRTTPEEVYDGLKRRRRRQQRAGLDLCTGFGSWDEGLLTDLNTITGTWEELSKEQALERISEVVNHLSKIYEHSCERYRAYDSSFLKFDAQANQGIEEIITHYLGNPEVMQPPLQSTLA